MDDLSKLCIHTITTKPLPFEVACEKYSRAGVKGLTIWQDAINGIPPSVVKKTLKKNGLQLVSYCRGGFFPNVSKDKRQEAISDNLDMIEEAAAIGAPMIVLVCGADPKQPLEISRNQIEDGIKACLPVAAKHNIKLAIEPLHPMYADERSAINTLKQANDMAEKIRSPYVGIAVDVYHLWWDPDLEKEIHRCGNNNHLFAYHVCDWKTPTTHMLLDRGLMGEGCIELKKIRSWIEKTGFDGFHEVEIFSRKYWAEDQNAFIDKIIQSYKNYA